MNKDYVGFGVIGCGVISPFHITSIKETAGAKLIAVCDIVEEKAKATSEREGVPYYTDYKKMLRNKDIDVVCICTPSSLHPEMAIAAARKGKNVITEKPMATRLERADAMIKECKKHNVKLACIFQRRVTEPFNTVKKLLDQGELGKLVLGDVYAKYYRSQAYYDSAGWRGTYEFDGGGALMNQSVHLIDLLQWYMGDVEEIYGHAQTLLRNIEVEDTSVAVLKFKNGAVGVIEGTTSVYPETIPHRVEIHGEKGSIMISGEGISKWEVMGEDGITINKLTASAGADKAITSPTDIYREGHKLQIADMVDSVKNNHEPIITGEAGRKALEIILAIYKSARTGKSVKLPLKKTPKLK